MGTVIYVYLDDNDLMKMHAMLHEKGITFWNMDKTLINEVQAFSNKYPVFYVGYDCESAVRFMPCFCTSRYIQCATFCIENKEDVTGKNIFEVIKKYIRQTYMLSQDKSYYIGPSMYQGWLVKKYSVPMPFRYDECFYTENEIENLFCEIQAEGYIIKENKARLRKMNMLDLSAESFVIFAKLSDILSTIVNKNTIYYEYGSDCVFVYRNRKTKTYRFIIDRRIADDPYSYSSLLFEKIKNRQFGENRKV